MPIDNYDLIMSDNIRFAHGNTGWTYTKSTNQTIALYQAVINLNLESTSRDQQRTNEVLESTFGREIIRAEKVESVRSDYVASNPDFPETLEIKVHILDIEKFVS